VTFFVAIVGITDLRRWYSFSLSILNRFLLSNFWRCEATRWVWIDRWKITLDLWEFRKILNPSIRRWHDSDGCDLYDEDDDELFDLDIFDFLNILILRGLLLFVSDIPQVDIIMNSKGCWYQVSVFFYMQLVFSWEHTKHNHCKLKNDQSLKSKFKLTSTWRACKSLRLPTGLSGMSTDFQQSE